MVTRVRSGAITLLAAAMCLLLLQLAQVCVEAIEALLPEDPVPLHPLRRIPQAVGLEPGGAPLGVTPARDQPGLLEHLEVLRYGWEGHVKGSRQLGDGGLARGEPGEDRAPGRIRDRRERCAEPVGRHATY